MKYDISSEITLLRKQLDEYKSLYKRAASEVDSLHARLAVEVEINDQYRQFFTTNPEYCNWLRDHNLQFEAFKNSPYYIKSFPQVARLEEQE